MPGDAAPMEQASSPAGGPAPPAAVPAVSPAPQPATTPPSVPSAGQGAMDRLRWYTVPSILVGVPILFALLSKLSGAFYESVVWKYYWGPIKADAQNVESLVYHGVVAHSGYNVVNTLTWALLLGLCILGLAQMLRHYRTTMTPKLIVAAASWVLAGSVFHVMEDVGLFAPPMQYLFITPPIYLLFAAGGVGAFLVGQYLRSVSERAGVERALQKLWFILAIPVLLWLALWLKDWGQIVAYVNPAWVAGFAAATFLVARFRAKQAGRIDPSELVLTLSLGVILLSLAYVASYIDDPWTPPTSDGMPSAVFWAPLLAGAVTLLVYLSCLLFGKGDLASNPYAQPINLLLVFSQMLDGFATSLGIDLAGYSEKHVLSARVIDWTRQLGESMGWEFVAKYPSFVGFATVKLLVSLLVIYAIDVRSRKDVEEHPTMVGLVKFAIIMVGLGPGVRDFVRLSLGV